MTTRWLYRLTAGFGLIGFVSYLVLSGLRPALGFALGSFGSLGNLALFDWLAHGIKPGKSTRKPWRASAFATRYLLLFLIGYAAIKALNINPLPVVLGLLTSTVAALVWAVAGLFGARSGTRRAH
jgi:hypothetical protein